MTIFSSLSAAQSFGFHFFAWTGEEGFAIVRKSFGTAPRMYYANALARVNENEV